MTTFEIIKKLAQRHDKSLQQVAEDLGFSKNLFYRWKTADPKAKDLEKVADYFGVTIDYLLGRPDRKETNVELSDDDVIMTWRGKPLSDEDRELIRRIMNGK